MAATLVSADDHVDLCYIPPAMWQQRVPKRFRDAAPKVADTPKGPFWVREGKPWGNAGSRSSDGRKVVFDLTGVPEQPEPGVWRPTAPKYRLQDMDADGIAAQIIYNFLDWSFTDQALKTYNSWLAEEFCPAAPDRLIGLATLPAHDPRLAARELERVAKLGLRGAIFDVFSATLSIADPAWDPLWAAAAETGLPLSVHVGGGMHSVTKHIHEVPWGRAAAAGLFGMQLDEILSLVLMCGMLERHPKLMVPNEQGVPEPPQRVHWDNKFTQDTLGLPGAYDLGLERLSWMCQAATDWIGDDGFLSFIDSRYRRFNYLGDVTWATGKVAEKFERDGKKMARLDLWTENHRDQVTATAEAEVSLISRDD